MKAHTSGYILNVLGTPGYVAPRLKGFMFYARTEMAPPSPNEFGEIAVRFGKGLKTVSTFGWVNYSVKVSIHFRLHTIC